MRWNGKRMIYDHCYQIDFTDSNTGATSPIDVVHTDNDSYTAAEYIKNVRENANSEYIDMVTCGTISVTKCY